MCMHGQNEHMVTFETKVYENDWEYLLGLKFLKLMVDRCNYNFAAKTLWINNVIDPSRVLGAARVLQEQCIITKYELASNYEKEALDFFGLSKTDFGKGYYYSIAELVGILKCETKYLLHFSSDAMMEADAPNWIDDAIYEMENNPNVIVANPAWNSRFHEARSESQDESELFYYGQGFSDQCYLINAERFRSKIYSFIHPDSSRYPSYGGELFEKRIDSYLRCMNLKRITSKRATYLHRNYPKGSMGKCLLNLLAKTTSSEEALLVLGAIETSKDGFRRFLHKYNRIWMR